MLGLVPNPTALPPLTDSEPLQSRIESNFALAQTLFAKFPKLVSVATSLRSGESSSNNHYAAMLTEREARTPLITPCVEGTLTPYYIDTIIDRVGAGDAFAAGLIHALTSDDLNAPASALQFATAAAVLAHSFEGDANLASRPEIQDLTQNRSPGRVRR
jgi:2-dehydro-3-deoxygluconokinase